MVFILYEISQRDLMLIDEMIVKYRDMYLHDTDRDMMLHSAIGIAHHSICK